MRRYTKISHPETEWSKRSYFKNQLEQDATEKSNQNYIKMLNRYNNNRLNLIQASMARQFAGARKEDLFTKIENDLISSATEGFEEDKGVIEQLVLEELDKAVDSFVAASNSANQEFGLNNIATNLTQKINEFKAGKISAEQINAEIDKYIGLLKTFLSSDATIVQATAAIQALNEVKADPLKATRHLIYKVIQENASSVFSSFITDQMTEQLTDIENTITGAGSKKTTLGKVSPQRVAGGVSPMSKVNISNINALPVTITIPSTKEKITFNIDLNAKVKNSMVAKNTYNLYSNYGQKVTSISNFNEGVTTFRKLVMDNNRFKTNSFAEGDSAYYQTLYYNSLRRANFADGKVGYQAVVQAIVSSYADLIVAGSGSMVTGGPSLQGLLDVNQVLILNGKAYNMMTLLENLKLSNGVFSNLVSAHFNPRGVQANDVIDSYANALFTVNLKANILQNMLK